MSIKLGLGQLIVGSDKALNRQNIADAAMTAARHGVRLLVFPEASMYGFGKPNDPLDGAAEPLDGTFVSMLRELSHRHNLWILAGMFERIDGDNHVYNTLVLTGDDGRLHGVYRKIHLYDAFGYKESDRMRAGSGETSCSSSTECASAR